MKTDDIKNLIAARAAGRLRPLAGWPLLPDGTEFWIAGGCLIREGNDVDLFCPTAWPTAFDTGPCEFRSKNAVTFKRDGSLFQFCSYRKPTLAEMLASFDFAHCQIGACVKLQCGHFFVSGVEWTEAFALSRVADTSWFTGSEYPLSSLMRAQKYRKSGILSSGAAIRAGIDTLAAVVKRGFKDYADFKDQLDAVDLGLVPEQLSEVERSSLTELFALLHKQEPHNG